MKASPTVPSRNEADVKIDEREETVVGHNNAAIEAMDAIRDLPHPAPLNGECGV